MMDPPFKMVFQWFPVPASQILQISQPPIRLFGHKRWHIGTLSKAGQNSGCILVYLRSLYSTPCKMVKWWFWKVSWCYFVTSSWSSRLVVPHFPYTAYPLSKAPVAVSSYRAKVVPDQGQLQKQANADGFKMDPIHNSLTNVVSFFDLLKCIILANHWFQRKLISYFKSTPHTNTSSSDGSMLVVWIRWTSDMEPKIRHLEIAENSMLESPPTWHIRGPDTTEPVLGPSYFLHRNPKGLVIHQWLSYFLTPNVLGYEE